MSVVTATSVFQQFTHFGLQHVLSVKSPAGRDVTVSTKDGKAQVIGRINAACYDDSASAAVSLLEQAVKRLDSECELTSVLNNVIWALNIMRTTASWCSEQ